MSEQSATWTGEAGGAPLHATQDLFAQRLTAVETAVSELQRRLATLPLLGIILTIQLFVYPQAWPEHLVWTSILLFLLTRGAGPISVDRVISRVISGPDRSA